MTGVRVRVCFRLEDSEPDVDLFASVLPASRSVQVGQTATIFATIINAGTDTGTQCFITAAGGAPPALLDYQTTDSVTNAPTGTVNEPVSLPGGASQSFVVSITPQGVFDPIEFPLTFRCSEATAPSFAGLNTVLLSSDSAPVADVVALGATPTGDGIANLDGTNGSGFFSLASVNVGTSADISVSVDTGNALLPVVMTICQTDPVTAVCNNPAVAATEPVELTIAENGTPTFAVFVSASEAIALDPASKRIYVRFRDAAGVVRGATSVAVETTVRSRRR